MDPNKYVFTYTASAHGLTFKWTGGKYIDVFSAGAEYPHATINLVPADRDRSRIPADQEAFERECEQWLPRDPVSGVEAADDKQTGQATGKPTPADEMRAAARTLRLLVIPPSRKMELLGRTRDSLADLLDEAAMDAEEGRHQPHALAVARDVNGQTP